MSYTIGNLGYGCAVPHNILRAMEGTALQEVLEGIKGVHVYYSASDCSPIFIGVEVNKFNAIDEIDIERNLLSNFKLSNLAYTAQIDAIKERIIQFVSEDADFETVEVFKEFVEWLKTNEAKKIIVWSNS